MSVCECLYYSLNEHIIFLKNKATILGQSTKIIFASLFGIRYNGLDMASSIQDSKREIKHVLVEIVSVKTSSTLYNGAVLLTKWLCLFLSTHNQHKIVICPHVWKLEKFMEVSMCIAEQTGCHSWSSVNIINLLNTDRQFTQPVTSQGTQ